MSLNPACVRQGVLQGTVVGKTQENLGKLFSEVNYITASGRTKQWRFIMKLMKFWIPKLETP